MTDDGKALLLQTAANMGKYYAFVGQALRAIADPAAAAQLPAGVLDAQLDQLRNALAPALDTNPVVRDNIDEVHAELARIRRGAADGAGNAAAVDEARRFGAQIQERAKAVSDLVALFRRL